ncbi:MAG: DUF6020 family protein, partial [Lachnospiraceae bacterium]|nr:DUF6020 family protein [Lachnospiraceae bacterium]
KDVPYILCLMVLMLDLWEFAETKGEELLSTRHAVELLLCALLVIMIRNNGVYFIVLAIPVCLFIAPKRWKQVLLCLLVPVLFYHFIWMGLLMPAWKVAPGGRQEGIGFAFQMTARYVQEHEADVTEEEKEIIGKLLPYEELTSLYSPEITDPVKYRFRQSATDEEVKDYLKLWVRMFFRHPDSYIQSSLNIAYKMFDLGQFVRPCYYQWTNKMDKSDELYADNLFVSSGTVKKLRSLDRVLWNIPGFGLILNVAAYFWLSILSVVEIIRKRRYRFLAALLPVLLTEVMMFVAPTVSGRYMMPLVFSAVEVIWLTVYVGGKMN